MAGISLAPGADWNDPAPTWDRIDNAYNVQAWSIDRGRPNEMSRTDTGQATVELVDRTGDFDPTNPGGRLRQPRPALPGQDRTAKPGHRQHGQRCSVASSPRFAGRRTGAWNTPTSPSSWSTGSPCWPPARWCPTATSATASSPATSPSDEDLELDAVQTRINKVLDDVGWPAALRSIFTGNVGLWGTPTYAPRSTVLR